MQWARVCLVGVLMAGCRSGPESADSEGASSSSDDDGPVSDTPDPCEGAGGWVAGVAAEDGSGGEPLAIVSDSVGRIHVAFDTYASLGPLITIQSALWDGASWSTECIECSGWAGWQPSIGVDASGIPSALFALNEGQAAFSLATRALDTWEVENLPLGNAWDGALDVAADGTVHIVVHDVAGDLLHLQRAPGEDSFVSQVIGVESMVSNLSVRVIDEQTIHAVYVASAPRDSAPLRYARGSSSTWTIEDLATGVFSPSLAVDGEDRPSVAYVSGGTLELAVKNGDAWYSTEIRDAVRSVSSAVDANGHAHLAFLDLDDDIHYVEEGYGGWTSTRIAQADAWARPALVLVDDQPHVLYRAVYENALMHLRRSAECAD